MPSNQLAYNSKAGAALVDMFRQYAQLNPREIGELVKKQSAELAGNLYILTPRASGAEIQQKVESLGGRFIRAPRAFALKVGPKAKRYFKINASKTEKKARAARNRAGKLNKIRGKLSSKAQGTLAPVQIKRFKLVRMKGGKKKSVKGTGLRKGLTLTEERFAAIQLRLGRRAALSASWVPAMIRFGSNLTIAKGARGRATERPMSQAMIWGTEEKVTASISNTQEGIGTLNDRTRFVDKALDKTTANMRDYNERKLVEMARKFEEAAAKTKR